MSDSAMKALAAVLLMPGVLLMTVPLLFLYAFVARDLWTWFVVPFGLSPLTLWHAYGLSLLVSLWTHQANPSREGEKARDRIVYVILSPLWAWFFGWLIHLYGM